MAATTRQPAGRSRWTVLLRPRWLAWHLFAVVATAGMLVLGDWQLHRAESGNELSWAYTFEWPLFAAFGVYFWFKSLRDELREPGSGTAELAAADSAAAESVADGFGVGAAGAVDDSHGAVTAAPAGAATAGPSAASAAGMAATARAVGGRRADSWDATSWDATSWEATGRQPGADGSAQPVDIARATPADGDAYVARLMAEVQRSGRRRGQR